jgi:hypothetical protein
VTGDDDWDTNIARTWDGGQTWAVASLPTDVRVDTIFGIACPSTLVCWLDGLYNSDSSLAVERSTDGGGTWARVSIPAGIEQQTVANPAAYGISCPDTNHCRFESRRLVLTTDDNGNTWSLTTPSSPITRFGDSLSCPDNTHCFIGDGVTTTTNGGAALLGSSDGGRTWTLVNSLPAPPGTAGALKIYGIVCVSALDCTAAGNTYNTPTPGAYLATTTNGWSSFQTPTAPSVFHDLQSVSCPDVNRCWSAGNIGAGANSNLGIAATTDGGATWVSQATPGSTGPSSLNSVSCAGSASATTCFAVATGSTYATVVGINTGAPPPPPGAVQNVMATGAESSASVTWSPLTANPPVDEYAATLVDANGDIINTASVCSSCTSASFSGLNDGESYEIAVAAHSAGGFGPETYSNTVTPPLPTSTSPAPPIPPTPCATSTTAATRTYSFKTIAGPLAAPGVHLPTGVLPHTMTPTCNPSGIPPAAESAGDVKYRGAGGGTDDVEITTTVYLVFWEPYGDAPADPNYNSTVIRFFRDLVYAETNNVGKYYFDLLQQYYQLAGGSEQHISGQISFGGAVLDPTPYTSGFSEYPCNSAVMANTGMACLGDGDIATEADAAAQQEQWSEDHHSLFLVFTGEGAIVCDNFAQSPAHCSPPSANTPAPFTCGYHAAQANPFKLGEVYGAVAYPIGGCTLQTTNFPNSSVEVDSAISTASHELFESVSDPLGHGWCGDGGYMPFINVGPVQAYFCTGDEIGDKCRSAFGPKDPQGGDIILNGDFYLVQEEWSNRAPISPTELNVNGQTVAMANKCSMY